MFFIVSFGRFREAFGLYGISFFFPPFSFAPAPTTFTEPWNSRFVVSPLKFFFDPYALVALNPVFSIL